MEEKRKLLIVIVVQTNHERSFRIAPDYQKAIISTFFFLKFLLQMMKFLWITFRRKNILLNSSQTLPFKLD